MYPNLRLLTLLGILSLTFITLAGCGEKRVHVATLSGAPGENSALDPMPANLADQSTSGLDDAAIDESALSSQNSVGEATLVEPTSSVSGEEPIHMNHEPANLSSLENSAGSSSSNSMPNLLDSEFSDGNSPLGNGQDFSAQSSSTANDQLNGATTNNVQEPISDQYADSMGASISQDTSSGLQDTLGRDNLEPLPDTLQIAKVEPSSSLQDRMDKLKNEELAAAAAGLEDVFFQFDSWALTQEGKQSLERTLGWFEQTSTSNLLVEGHADQRGTQAYNMVLAKKRAVAVQEYLSQLGVPASRIAVISYGKDKPFCQDATEVCYQLNRRGHLLVPVQ